MNCFGSCAVAWDFIDANLVKQFLERHIKVSPPRTTYPTADQVDRLVANAAPMTGRIIRLLAEAGMRREEVCRLKWSQVSIQQREIWLTETKTSSPRVVPLSDEALRTITGTPRYLTAPYVFWHDNGQMYSSFAVIARRADVPFRCHDLHHAFASRFLLATGNILALQAILGHRLIQMTMRYANLHHVMTDFGTRDGIAGAVSLDTVGAGSHASA